MEEKLRVLDVITNVLDANHLSYSIGGSGLLYSLGLTSHVNDWDITTNEPLEKIIESLKKFSYTVIPSEDSSLDKNYKILIKEQNVETEIIINPCIPSPTGVFRLPTMASVFWNGKKFASPEVWFVAYKLMKREEKASILQSYILKNGAAREIIQMLIREPLPTDILNTLHRFSR